MFASIGSDDVVADLRKAQHPAIRVHRFSLLQPWHPARAQVSLTAVYCCDGSALRTFVTDAHLAQTPDAGNFQDIAAQHAAAIIEVGAPLRLQPVTVDKPWGREIWYTGIETRGVASVCSDTGATPLPWALASAPRSLCNGQQPLLTKLLEPSGQPGSGDLYLELHQHKEEVYVVKTVDRRSWPDGVGAVLLGANQQLRADIGDDPDFRTRFHDAAASFETQSDAEGDASGRAALDCFTERRELRPGDVVVVPPLIPHSLQHGVTVLEFQTAWFERLIIAASQPVATQAHWDTRDAIEAASLEAVTLPDITTVQSSDGCRIEQLASTPAFGVRRITLDPGAATLVTGPLPYAVTAGMLGTLNVGGIDLVADETCLLPGETLGKPGIRFENPTDTPASCVVAAPGL